MNNYNFEKFSHNYKKSLQMAANLAMELQHQYINPEHILYGLVAQKGSVASSLFVTPQISSEVLRNKVAILNQSNQKQTPVTINQEPQFSSLSKQLIQKSVQIAYINKHKYIGTEHLMAAILQLNNEEIKRILKESNISEQTLSQQVVSVLKSVSKLPDLTESFKVIDDEENDNDEVTENQSPKTANVLDIFGNELTNEKFQKNIDPVIGRDEEINRIIQILSRRTKNNPIILGEPGVGKTAVVEGLAKRIMQNNVPEALQNKKIYSVDLTSTVAGTMFRGEFENRIKQIIDEATKRPEVILFIDEIHNIVGVGSASGSMDAANILKPALARGQLHLIGATTFNDYRKSIENDQALARRFQAIKLEEPSAEEAKTILHGIKKYFEDFHQVSISSDAIDAAVTLSQRYLPDKFLPDKAIDLIDEASSAVKVGRKLTSQEQKIKNLKKELKDFEKKKKQAIGQEDFILALKIKDDFEEVEKKLNQSISDLEKQKNYKPELITDKDIAKVISRSTGIPSTDLLSSEKKQILQLDKNINQYIIGQETAIKQIADYIKRAKAGLTAEKKPLASFLMLGPSGVGKTYTAKILAKTLFGDEKSLIKIDMSEYSEKFNISKLIGAPAGYVGYKESGLLTEKIKHRPYSIILFDEIEKANRDIFDLLLQVLDDGFLTDASGTKINFQNTIILMTSNIGSQYFQKTNYIGFKNINDEAETDAIEEKIIAETKNYLKIEFLNRIDKLIYFHPLNIDELEKIAKKELEILAQRLNKKNIKLKFDNSALKAIAQKSFSPTEGARAVNRTIYDLIETPISYQILEDKISSGSIVQLTAKNGIIKLRKQ